MDMPQPFTANEVEVIKATEAGKAEMPVPTEASSKPLGPPPVKMAASVKSSVSLSMPSSPTTGAASSSSTTLKMKIKHPAAMVSSGNVHLATSERGNPMVKTAKGSHSAGPSSPASSSSSSGQLPTYLTNSSSAGGAIDTLYKRMMPQSKRMKVKSFKDGLVILNAAITSAFL